MIQTRIHPIVIPTGEPKLYVPGHLKTELELRAIAEKRRTDERNFGTRMRVAEGYRVEELGLAEFEQNGTTQYRVVATKTRHPLVLWLRRVWRERVKTYHYAIAEGGE